KFVKHVRDGSGNVSHRIMTKHQAFKHGLVNGSADALLVGANRIEACPFDRRRNHGAVNGIEIGEAAGRIELPPERHQHEAKRSRLFELVECVHVVKPAHRRKIMDQRRTIASSILDVVSTGYYTRAAST